MMMKKKFDKAWKVTKIYKNSFHTFYDRTI